MIPLLSGDCEERGRIRRNKRDYIMRLVEQIAALVASIVAKERAGKYPEAKAEIDEKARETIGLSLEEVLKRRRIIPVRRLREFPMESALLILFTASALIAAEPDAQQEEKLYLNKFEPQEIELDGYSISESPWKDNKNAVCIGKRQSFARLKFTSKGDLLKKSKEFEDDHNNDNYSDDIEDASVHAADSYQNECAVARIHPD